MSDLSFSYNSTISSFATNIAQSMLQGCLLEISTTPKPGLITPVSTGSHNDMNFQTFLLSSATIYPCFLLSANLGLEHSGALADVLPRIREFGINFEDLLLESTKQVNTQRGVLFLGSIVCASVGLLEQRKITINAENICKKVAEICSDICHRELEKDLNDNCSDKSIYKDAINKSKPTAGQLLYKKYGLKGIRGEVEAGLPNVLNIGFPIFTETFKTHSLNDSLAHTLLHLISSCDDSTIVWRSDMKQLEIVKNKSLQVIKAGSVFTKEGREKLNEFSDYCEKNRLSPGGSADLLAATVAIYIMCFGSISSV